MTCSKMFYKVVSFIEVSRDNPCRVVGVPIKKRRLFVEILARYANHRIFRESSECALILSLESRMYG